MKRILFFVYGVVCYLFGFSTLMYLIAFLGDFIVPKTIDGIPEVPVSLAIIKNLVLVLLFGVQHSLMARPWFKEKWTKIIPESLERSTYVLFTFFALGFLMWQWAPLGGEIWSIGQESTLFWVMYAFFGLGWGILFIATFLINHFDLFGLRQVYLYLVNKPYTQLKFKERFFYKSVRHPIYTGLLFGMWFTPHMTVSHLLVALAWTLYIFYAIGLEERDLIGEWGDKYREYMSRTGGVLPNVWKLRAKRFPQPSSKS